MRTSEKLDAAEFSLEAVDFGVTTETVVASETDAVLVFAAVSVALVTAVSSPFELKPIV